MPSTPEPRSQATLELREAIVGAMPWYDEANPDYTELDQIIDGVLFDAKAFAEVVVQRNQALDAYGDCIADNVRLRGAAQEWADLCNDYDLNERGQAIMGRLRAALAK